MAEKKADPAHSKEHMDKMHKKRSEAAKRQMLEKVKIFQQKANEYFQQQDEGELAYSEAGLANAMGWTVRRMQNYYDINDSKSDEAVDAQVAAFENGGTVDEPTVVMSHFVRLAYQRIQEQIDTSPIYQEKGMVTRGIFLNKQKRLGGYQDKQETRQDVSVNVTFGDGVDASDFK